jgi:hypothetical protein
MPPKSKAKAKAKAKAQAPRAPPRLTARQQEARLLKLTAAEARAAEDDGPAADAEAAPTGSRRAAPKGKGASSRGSPAVGEGVAVVDSGELKKPARRASTAKRPRGAAAAAAMASNGAKSRIGSLCEDADVAEKGTNISAKAKGRGSRPPTVKKAADSDSQQSAVEKEGNQQRGDCVLPSVAVADGEEAKRSSVGEGGGKIKSCEGHSSDCKSSQNKLGSDGDDASSFMAGKKARERRRPVGNKPSKFAPDDDAEEATPAPAPSPARSGPVVKVKCSDKVESKSHEDSSDCESLSKKRESDTDDATSLKIKKKKKKMKVHERRGPSDEELSKATSDVPAIVGGLKTSKSHEAKVLHHGREQKSSRERSRDSPHLHRQSSWGSVSDHSDFARGKMPTHQPNYHGPARGNLRPVVLQSQWRAGGRAQQQQPLQQQQQQQQQHQLHYQQQQQQLYEERIAQMRMAEEQKKKQEDFKAWEASIDQRLAACQRLQHYSLVNSEPNPDMRSLYDTSAISVNSSVLKGSEHIPTLCGELPRYGDRIMEKSLSWWGVEGTNWGEETQRLAHPGQNVYGHSSPPPPPPRAPLPAARMQRGPTKEEQLEMARRNRPRALY